MPTFQDMNSEDVALLASIALGDKGAMASLDDLHSQLVYSVAQRVCRDSVIAEQIVQSVLMQVWLVLQQFASTRAGLNGRLGLLSRNLAIDPMHGRKAINSSEKPSLNRPFDPISHTEVSRLMQKPHAPVLLLPDADRQVLEMAFFDGKTSVEIAEETGFPVDMIGRRLRDALSAMRNMAADTANVSEETGLEVLDLDTHKEFIMAHGRTAAFEEDDDQ